MHFARYIANLAIQLQSSEKATSSEFIILYISTLDLMRLKTDVPGYLPRGASVYEQNFCSQITSSFFRSADVNQDFCPVTNFRCYHWRKST